MKTISLTLEQWERITDSIELTQDDGPVGEGWKSDELSAAECALNTRLDSAPIWESNVRPDSLWESFVKSETKKVIMTGVLPDYVIVDNRSA